jgi:hypothetical protein
MSKIDVGVGEDFPVGDGNKGAGAQDAQNSGADDRAEFEAWKRRRDDERHYYEDRHRRHEEWHQRKQEFKDRVKAAARDFHHDARDYHGRDHGRDEGHDRDWHGRGWHFGRFWPMGIGIALLVLAIPVLIIALFFSLISAAFKAPFVILAIVAIAALFFTLHHRRGYHRFGYSGHGHHRHGHYRYYTEDDIQTPPRPQQPQQNSTPPTITPTPPATGE